jgi:hypothetical protein
MDNLIMTMTAFSVMTQLALINLSLIDIKNILYKFKK